MNGVDDIVQARAFVEAILAAPQDDGPRLMYADWMKERGLSHGDFIEAQIRLHHEGKTNGRKHTDDVYNWLYERSDPLTADLWARCADYVKGHKDQWSATLPEKVYIKGWSRGFPGHLGMKLAIWNVHADRLRTLWPVEKVTFVGKLMKPEKKWEMDGRTMTSSPTRVRFPNRPWVVVPDGTLYANDLLRRLLYKEYWPGIRFVE